MQDAVIARCRAEIERFAGDGLETARAEDDLAALMRDVDRVVRDALQDGGPQRLACGAGCASCCTINVGTLGIEGALAAGFLRRSMSPDEVPALAERLRAFHASVRWLEDRERVRGAFRCPFLDAQRSCRIHPVRPIACRSVSSVDAGDCRRAMTAEIDDDDGPPMVRMHVLQKTLYDEALEIVRDAVRRRGLDARCRDVSGMTALFLGDRDLLQRYLAGGELPIE